MSRLRSFGWLIVAAALASSPALAQQSAPSPAAAPAAPPASTAPANLPGVVATTNNPNLAVASVRLENGTRASKMIGASVYGDGDQQIGAIDDLIMTGGDQVTVAIVSVGGFLGYGAKLVAFPYSQLRLEGQHLTLPGATKDSLNAMPNFQY